MHPLCSGKVCLANAQCKPPPMRSAGLSDASLTRRRMREGTCTCRAEPSTLKLQLDSSTSYEQFQQQVPCPSRRPCHFWAQRLKDPALSPHPPCLRRSRAPAVHPEDRRSPSTSARRSPERRRSTCSSRASRPVTCSACWPTTRSMQRRHLLPRAPSWSAWRAAGRQRPPRRSPAVRLLLAPRHPPFSSHPRPLVDGRPRRPGARALPTPRTAFKGRWSRCRCFSAGSSRRVSAPVPARRLLQAAAALWR